MSEVIKYTDGEVIKYWEENIGTQKTRKPEYIDKRNYVLALLYYEFKYVEVELAQLFGVERSSINHAKDIPYEMLKNEDIKFKKHTEELRVVFPYLFPEGNKGRTPNIKFNLMVPLDRDTKNLLKKYCKLRGRRINQGAEELIKKALSLFEDILWIEVNDKESG